MAADEPAEADGDRRRRSRRGADPRYGRAVPRLHVDVEGGARPAADRELRDARLRRPWPERLLRRRDPHAPLAHLRGSRRLVPQPSTSRTGSTRRSVPASRCATGRRRSHRSRRTTQDRGSTSPGDYARHRRIGHSGLDPDRVAARSTTSSARTAPVYSKGTAVPQRADFNTLDNPFFWSCRSRSATACSSEAAAGVHFVVFNPTSDDFRRVRLAMDGVLPDGTTLRLRREARPGRASTQVLSTTHRQNFLVPPRRQRSFPLAGVTPHTGVACGPANCA